VRGLVEHLHTLPHELGLPTFDDVARTRHRLEAVVAAAAAVVLPPLLCCCRRYCLVLVSTVAADEFWCDPTLIWQAALSSGRARRRDREARFRGNEADAAVAQQPASRE
jgi:hypothetical protein